MSSTAPRTLDAEECTILLNQLQSSCSTPKRKRAATRNYCMALLMLDAGLRVGELVSLKISDLFFNGEPVRAIVIEEHMTKSKTRREIPVSTRLSEALRNYYLSICYLDRYIQDYPAFYSPRTQKALTTRQIERIICKAAEKSLNRPLNPHVLRHTAATKWMRVTNARVVQQLLGHRYLSSTQVYCHPNSQDLRDAVERAASLPSGLAAAEEQNPVSPPEVSSQRPEPVPAAPFVCRSAQSDQP